LKIGEDAFPKQKPLRVLKSYLVGAQFRPQAIDLSRRRQLQIDAALH